MASCPKGGSWKTFRNNLCSFPLKNFDPMLFAFVSQLMIRCLYSLLLFQYSRGFSLFSHTDDDVNLISFILRTSIIKSCKTNDSLLISWECLVYYKQLFIKNGRILSNNDFKKCCFVPNSLTVFVLWANSERFEARSHFIGRWNMIVWVWSPE